MLNKIDLDLKLNESAAKVFVSLLDFHGCSGKDQISPKQQICFLKIMYYSIFTLVILKFSTEPAVKLGDDGRLCRMAEYFFADSYNSIA
jgi:hypothetical protein